MTLNQGLIFLLFAAAAFVMAILVPRLWRAFTLLDPRRDLIPVPVHPRRQRRRIR